MSTDESNGIGGALEIFGQDLERARKHWWMFLLLGILLVLGGIVVISYPFVSSVGAVMVLGIILIISGIFTVFGAFWSGRWGAFFLQLLVGILYVVAGMAIRDTPVESTALLTMFIAAFFIVIGAFRIVVSVIERFPHWGWALLNGVITLLAGIIIYDSYPFSALWVIGLLVGIELLFNGWSWIMMSLIIRKVPTLEQDAS